METLSKFLISAIELVEAELRSLNQGITRLGLKLVAVLVAGVLGLIGTILLLMAFYMLLAKLLGDIAATAIVGALFAGGAAGLVIWALHKPAKKPVMSGPPEAFGSGTAGPINTDSLNTSSNAGGTDEGTVRIAS